MTSDRLIIVASGEDGWNRCYKFPIEEQILQVEFFLCCCGLARYDNEYLYSSNHGSLFSE